MHVFVVLATHISENTVMTEVRGVFTHITEALPYVAALRNDGYLVRVQKHNVYSAPEPTRSLSMGGVQTVSAQPVGPGPLTA